MDNQTIRCGNNSENLHNMQPIERYISAKADSDRQQLKRKKQKQAVIAMFSFPKSAD
jgi:hypothetical protein